jgi:hypothetical protein
MGKKFFMKKEIFVSVFVYMIIATLCSCYKDKGNYAIEMPEEPQITGLDTLYEASVGDSLIITPTISGIDPASIQCNWRIDVPEATKPETNHYEGKDLRIAFGLEAKRYRARLTVTNKVNGMKYFYNFYIQGTTAFSRGSLVLSVDHGLSKLSFIKPDHTVQANIYEIINNEVLPANPLHIHYVKNQFTGNTPLGYWIISKNGGVRLDVNNLKREILKPGTLYDNFFLAPPSIDVDNLKTYPQGALLGVINGKFYAGATTTWDQSATYGMFGTFADGDYELSPQFVITAVDNNFTIIGFEKNKKQFIRINMYGSPMYFGTQYTSVNTEIFDPADVGMDLLQMVQVNNTDTYAFVKDHTGKVYELKFKANFSGPFLVTANHKKLFFHQEWINADTKMVASRIGYIYIGYQNKVFRYNPLNQQVQELKVNLPSSVSLLKLDDDENTLIAGAGGSLYYLDIQVGKDGELLHKIDGIPGEVVDLTWRK